MNKILSILLLAVFIRLSPAAESPTTAPSVPPPASLILQNIPPIPQSIADDARRFTDYRSAALAAWHPSKREMLIQTRFADTVQIHEVKQPLGMRKQITFFADGVSSAVYPPVDNPDAFYFTKDVGGNEFAQIYRYDLASGDVTMLTDGKSRNSRPLFSEDGKKFVYTSTRRNRKDPDFYVADSVKPEQPKMIFQADAPGWAPLHWSHDGAKILAEKFASANESSLWIIDAATGEKQRVSPKTQEKTRYSSGVFSADDKGIFCTTDAGSEFERLALIDLATKTTKVLTPDLKWDVEDFELSHDGKTIAYVVNRDGLGDLNMMEAATGKEMASPLLPPGQVSGLRFHRNDKELGFVLNSAKAPSDVYSTDIATCALTRWTESETAGLNTQQFPDPQLIRWKSFDGKEISGFAYHPDPKQFPGKRPVIINIHGGPESQYRPGFMGPYNYYFTRLGVAAIFPNVRGSAGYGKTYLTLDDGKKREDSVKDIGALLDWIKTQPDLDADRVMVTGGSYGGYMSLAVSTHYSDRLRCSIDVVGISNFISFLERTEPYRQDLRRVEYGDERDPEMRKVLEEISPLRRVGDIKKPMFIVHGQNDPRVPLNEAQQIFAALQKQGTPAWMMIAKDEGHGFAKKPNQQFQFFATIEYVREYLLK